jgi:hypothetical protein
MSIIPKVVELLRKAESADNNGKVKKVQHALNKENFEKKFWHLKCKLYAPNRMEQHYQELNEKLQEAGFYPKVDEDEEKPNQ